MKAGQGWTKSQTKKATQRGIAYDAILESSSDEVVRESIYADRSFIRVALLNVLHNAVKFSADHSTLRVIYENFERDGKPFHRVCVHDSGPGIAPGEHLRVFERFFSGSLHQTPAQHGAGLGLSIAKLVIDRCGGRIYFDGTAVQGAKCYVELPLSPQRPT